MGEVPEHCEKEKIMFKSEEALGFQIHSSELQVLL